MSKDLRRTIENVGVWRALGELKLRELAWPEGLVALAIGGGGGAYIVHATPLTARTPLALPVAGLGGAFLAVVFTALAIVVSLPSSSYLRMLADTPNGGMWRFLSPFLLAIGEQIMVILLALSYAGLATSVRPHFENVGFVAMSFVLTFGVLDIAALGRSLIKHGILRAEDAELETAETEVRQLAASRRQ